MMRERIFAIFDKWRALRDVAEMTDHELADLGITRTQMLDLVTMPADSPKRLEQMAAIFGLTADDVMAHHQEYTELLQTCGHCGARRKCAKTLADAEAADPAKIDFCPNANIYAAKAAAKSKLAIG